MTAISIEMLAVSKGYEIVNMKPAKDSRPRIVTLEKGGAQVTVTDDLIKDVADMATNDPLQFPGKTEAA